MESAITLAVALPIVAAALAPLAHRVLGNRTAYASAVVAATSFALLVVAGPAGRVTAAQWIDGPLLAVGLTWYADGLAMLIGLLASGIGVLVFVYSAGYMAHEPGQRKFYPTMLAFMASMIGVAYAGDLIVLFVFWELTSLTSFLLIGHYDDRPASLIAARKALLVTVAGGLFLLAGFVVLWAVADTTLIAGPGGLLADPGALAARLRDAGLFVPAIALLGVGAAAKSAQVPLHFWLPDAMEAPTPVSAFLHSATMVKAGVYLIGRFRPLFVGEPTGEWTLLIAGFALVSMTITAALAVAAEDIKALLAYSTASHLGMIIAGFGLASTVGAETGAFHILNHALFKAALFLVAGILAHEAGSRLLGDLGGLARELPIAAGVASVAALGMAGVPPFNGFYSKELLFEATYHLASHEGGLWWLFPALAVLASVCTVLYSAKFLTAFTGSRPDSAAAIGSPPWSMRAPAMALAGGVLVVSIGGLAPLVGAHLAPVEAGVASVVGSVGGHAGFGYHVPTHLTPPVAMSAIALAGGAAGLPVLDRIVGAIDRAQSTAAIAPSWWYRRALDAVETGDPLAAIESGRLRPAAASVLAATAGLTLVGYATAGLELPAIAGLPLLGAGVGSWAMSIVLVVAVGSALAVTRAPSHVAGVLTLSILGFMIAIVYILGDAPDLALTQLVVETLVLVLFLLVIDKLPAFYGEIDRMRAVGDAALATVVGATVTLTVLVTTAADPRLDAKIAQFFVARGPLPEGAHGVVTDVAGGHNLVNVILVDFRAFDTMGEISVVAMAALSVLTLIGMRSGGEQP
ncbi:MAG: hydrogen gas-evolving membrane-bound hydrogenase subunit E [Halococcoides sp.]